MVALSLALSSEAVAKPEYHTAIKHSTGTCIDCQLCHRDSIGNGTNWDLTKPFLRTVYPPQVGKLPPNTTDSDGDGESDITELAMRGDPNDPLVLSGQYDCPEEVMYGCAIGARSSSAIVRKDAGSSFNLKYLAIVSLIISVGYRCGVNAAPRA